MKQELTNDRYIRFITKWIKEERPDFEGEPLIIDKGEVIHVLLLDPGRPLRTEYIYFNTWYDCPEIFKMDYAD